MSLITSLLEQDDLEPIEEAALLVAARRDVAAGELQSSLLEGLAEHRGLSPEGQECVLTWAQDSWETGGSLLLLDLAGNESLHPSLQPRVFDLGARSDDMRSTLAANPATTPEVQHHLLGAGYLSSLVNNTHAVPEVLTAALASSDEDVHKGLAQNPRVDPLHLERFFEDPERRLDLAHNPALSNELKDRLVKIAAGSWELAAALRLSGHLSTEQANALARSRDMGVRWEAAQVPTLGVEAQRELAQGADFNLLWGLAENPGLDEDVALTLLRSGRMTTSLALNPALPDALREKLLAVGGSALHGILLGHANLGPELRWRIIGETDPVNLRQTPVNCPGLTLEGWMPAALAVRLPRQLVAWVEARGGDLSVLLALEGAWEGDLDSLTVATVSLAAEGAR